ncbi:MAG: chemotaxis protein CheW [Lachnospiraceae bacterium]|nr:chemotaxis protein CheW [Lachnospiraceae bacterium]MDD7149050.1 chemotaxis protein CheW [Lachnospiraceae bacterium]MDY4069915.1 chemotaxis protein CheW [Lachnospiraceae bacterium]
MNEDGYVEPVIVQFIVVKIGQEQYGINIKYIENIVRMQHITRVPQVPAYIKGVINLRGEVIPVMSLRLKMGLPEDVETKASRIIIIKMEQHGNIGLMVDEVKEVVNLEEDQIEKVSYGSRDNSESFILGIGKYEGGLISLLDLNVTVLDRENV